MGTRDRDGAVHVTGSGVGGTRDREEAKLRPRERKRGCSGDTGGDAAVEGTGDPSAASGPGDALGHLSEAPGDATTAVAPVPASPGGDRALVGTHGDVGMEVTGDPGVTNGTGDALGHPNKAPGDATTVVPPAPVTPGGDKALVGTHGDVGMEVTGDPGATGGPGDALGHLNKAPGDATTAVPPAPVTPGGDKVLVGTQSDVTMEGTGDPGVTGGPGDALGHLNESPGDATTVVAPVTATAGGDKEPMSPHGDVAVEVTAQPGVTGGPGDVVGHLNESPGDATTVVTLVTTSPGGDKVLAGASGDVGMEVTGDPGATGGPGDMVGHLSEAPGDATTAVPPAPVTPGGDKALVGAHGDAATEGTEETRVLCGPGDSVGRVTEAPGDATTVVAPVTTSPGGDKVLVATQSDVTMEGTGSDKMLVATQSDVAMEGTEDPGVTGGPGDIEGHLNETPGDATTVVAPVPTRPGSDKLLVATEGGVAMEGTAQPDVTGGPGDIVGHLNETPGDATTTVTSVPASPGSDKALVATQSDVAMEGTEDPGVTGGPGDTLGHLNESPGDATTVVAPVTASPGGDKVLVGTHGDIGMEVTGDPGVTNGTRDALGHLNETPGDATTAVTLVTTSPGGDKVLVATQSDVSVEGTEDPGVTGGPGDTLGHLNETPGDATTVVAPVTTPPGSDKVLVANGGDAATEGTEETRVLCGPGDTLGRVPDVPGDATTAVPPVPVTPGGDKVLAATSGDVTMEGTEDPGVTGGPGDIEGHLNEAPGDATTVVPPVTTTPGGDKVLAGASGDAAVEGTEDPGATGGTGDASGHLSEAPGDATTAVPPVATPPGSNNPPMPRPDDVTMGAAAPPNVPNCSWDSLGRVPDVPKDQSAAATTPPAPMTSPPPSSAPSGGDAVMVAPGGDVMAPPPCRGPAPHAAFPVTAAPPPGLASSAPFPSWPRPLLAPLLLVLPLPLLLP
ncbi:collagen alpha-1(I) chain-like [Ammospiza caudacuta]|uniref:collagen alpha-1(I) chain-like n=1 Tax=Ammospiza caudacuta TaxID=2857398 RepID=UPI0027384233|nr:collagen alpha-1(I) chain-like [Ammospiza caudacuta]